MDWAKEFVKIFSQYSPSGLLLPKLHSWCYHVVPAIRKYGSINSMSTKTYETLHKDYVKIPYRMSNKKDYMKQILNTVCIKNCKSSLALNICLMPILLSI